MRPIGWFMERTLADRFCDHQRARGLSELTIARRRWSLAKFDDLLRVSVDELEVVLATLGSAEAKRAVCGDLHRFAVWARRSGLDVVDPTEMIDPVRVPGRLPTPISVEDLERLLDVTIAPTRWAVLLAAYAGLRVSEIAALRHEDLRRDLGLVIVRAGKGGKDGAVPLAPRLAAELPATGSGPMFPTLRGGRSVSSRIRRAMDRAGVQGRPHDLRHTFGTEAARVSGGNTFVVQRLLRHANLSSTQRYVMWSSGGADVVDRLYVA